MSSNSNSCLVVECDRTKDHKYYLINDPVGYSYVTVKHLKDLPNTVEVRMHRSMKEHDIFGDEHEMVQIYPEGDSHKIVMSTNPEPIEPFSFKGMDYEDIHMALRTPVDYLEEESDA